MATLKVTRDHYAFTGSDGVTTRLHPKDTAALTIKGTEGIFVNTDMVRPADLSDIADIAALKARLFNHNRKVAIGLKSGTLSAGSGIEVWGDASNSRTLPTSSANATLESSDAGDTAVVTVFGLNSDYEEVEADVTLSGTSQVAATGVNWRVNKLKVKSGTLAGNVTAKIGSDTQALMAAGASESFMTQRTIPANKEAVVSLATIRAGNPAAANIVKVTLRKKEFGSNIWEDVVGGPSGNDSVSYDAEKIIPAKAEIACYAFSIVGDAAYWSAIYWFELFDTI